MKKINFRLTLLMIGLPLMVLSCTSNEDNVINEQELENTQNEYISMGNLSLEPSTSTRSTALKSYNVNFTNEKGESMLHFNMITAEDTDLYGCDVDDDENSEFYVQFLNSGVHEFYYLDSQKKKLQKCSLDRKDNEKFVINVLEQYLMPSYVSTRTESWGDCFTRRMGSPLGVGMSVIAGFIGPEGTAAVAIGGALSCLLYDAF